MREKGTYTGVQDLDRTRKAMEAHCLSPCSELLAEVQLLENRPIAKNVFFLQVGEEFFPLADQIHQRFFGTEIFAVRLEVLGEVVDALGKERDLPFGRAGIGGRSSVGGENFLFLFCTQMHRRREFGGRTAKIDSLCKIKGAKLRRIPHLTVGDFRPQGTFARNRFGRFPIEGTIQKESDALFEVFSIGNQIEKAVFEQKF